MAGPGALLTDIFLIERQTADGQPAGSVRLTLSQLLGLFSQYFTSGGEGGMPAVHWADIEDRPTSVEASGLLDAATISAATLIAQQKAAEAVAQLQAGAPETFNNFIDAYNAWLLSQDAAQAVTEALAGKLTITLGLSEFVGHPDLQAQARASLGLGTAALLNADDIPSGSQTVTWSDIQGKPTLLAQTGISDVYTKTQVDQAATNAAKAEVAALTAGAPESLDQFVEVYNRFLTNESVAQANADALAGKLSKASNLSDLQDKPTARANLGLGDAATHAASDFAPAAQAVPATAGITIGWVLGINSSGAAAWQAPPAGGTGGTGSSLPSGAVNGQFLGYANGVATWTNVVAQAPTIPIFSTPTLDGTQVEWLLSRDAGLATGPVQGPGFYADSFKSAAGLQAASAAYLDTANGYVGNGYTKTVLNFGGADGATAIADATGFHAWTAYGAARVSATQSKFGGTSGAFLAAGDYMATPAHADFGMGTGDFTVDGWFYLTTVLGTQAIADFRVAPNTSAQFVVAIKNGKLDFFDGPSGTDRLGATTVTANAWHHFRVCRKAGTVYLFLDGALDLTVVTGNNLGTSGPIKLGDLSEGGAPLKGYLDDFRVIKGLALSTASFTVPSAATPAFGTFTVESVDITTLYTPNAASAYFVIENLAGTIIPNTNLFLDVSRDSGANWVTGTLVKTNTLGSGKDVWEAVNLDLSALAANSKLRFRLRATDPAVALFVHDVVLRFADKLAPAAAIPTGKSGSNLDKTQLAFLLAERANTLGATYAGPSFFADSFKTNNLLPGFAGTLDTVNGYLKMASTYPTGTTFVAHFDGADGSKTITDDLAHSITVTGNVALSSAQAVFGATSGAFTGGFILGAASTDFAIGTGDFTFAFRLRLTALTGADQILVDNRAAIGDGKAAPIMGVHSNGKFFINDAVTGALLDSTSALAVNTWYAVEVSRASGTLRIFINGAVDASVANTTNFGSTAQPMRIGARADAGTPIGGFVDEFLFMKGAALHNAAYTPATTAFGAPADLNAQTLDIPAAYVPGHASLYFAIENLGTPIVPNTNLIATVSRDAGATWVSMPLQKTDMVFAGRDVYEAQDVDVSGGGSGTNLRWKIVTNAAASGQNIRIHDAVLGWAA